MNALYVGADPSVHNTAIVWPTGTGKLWEGCNYPIREHIELKRNLRIAREQGKQIIAIERTLNFGVNPKTQDQLAEVRGRVIQMSADLGFEIVFVTPAEWQAGVLGSIPRGGKTSADRTANAKARKRMSIMVARDLGGDNALLGDIGEEDHNIADAMCICHYAHARMLRAIKEGAA